MTALSELVPANFSAVVRLMKPKPYESSNIPTTTPPAPVHREGFTTSQLILMGVPSVWRKKYCTRMDLAESEQNRSLQSAAFTRNPTPTNPGWQTAKLEGLELLTPPIIRHLADADLADCVLDLPPCFRTGHCWIGSSTHSKNR